MDHVSTTGNPDAATLTIPELSRLLNMNAKHLYALAQRGQLPTPINVKRIGRKVVVTKESVRQFLDLSEVR